MKRYWLIWTLFGLFLAVVMAAMGWVSAVAWRLDRAQAAARRQADIDERVQRALWRLDPALAPLIAQESVRPYFVYSSLMTLDRAYGRMFNDRNGSEALTPSPLLIEPAPHVRVYFQFDPDGKLSSPQVPLGNNYKLTVPRYSSPDNVTQADKTLKELTRIVSREKLLGMLPERPTPQIEIVLSPLNRQTDEQKITQRKYRSEIQNRDNQGEIDYSLRNMAVQQSANTMAQQQGQQFLYNGFVLPPTDVSGVLMTPLWIDGELVLARRVAVNGVEYVQGCLLDWPGLRTSLLETIEDLLPAADLVPATTVKREEERTLAALPVALVAGTLPLAEEEPPTAMLVFLGVAWGCVLLAALAVAGLLAGVLRLSERRASFVTAVTHELRTPLTTFQMYAEMLAEGMVPDAEQRQRYLNTLRAEAVRLTHMVENVLSFARLERGRKVGRLETMPVAELIGGMQSRLADRAGQGGMEFAVTLDSAADRGVRANVSAVEQILFNLVDNSCKYAAAAENRRIELSVGGDNGMVEVRLSDHGPGVSPDVRRRLFHSFAKTAQQAAHSAPGIGLGLALSRRLARDMGGDLRLEPDNGGAAFVLALPEARTA